MYHFVIGDIFVVQGGIRFALKNGLPSSVYVALRKNPDLWLHDVKNVSVRTQNPAAALSVLHKALIAAAGKKYGGTALTKHSRRTARDLQRRYEQNYRVS
jgi:hypothetical protein